MKKLIFALLLCSLLLVSTFMEPALARSAMCSKRCKARCGKLRARNQCVKTCNTCCNKCKCVPSYGSKHQCPCYREVRDYQGKLMCP
ncbi:hypothetical protein MLD38_023307 [Melastoma candidum]|uniref:Uncharacterized protein n=1 Tax=Melastoma candidum TaxID=119954 RepID=A0ACB9QM31_9MYRT|nr:hypothetical protein MLD38_023307 [Melastoma candidum]